MIDGEEKKIPRSMMWKMAVVTLVTVAIFIFYVISVWLLSLVDLSYRTWVEVPCKIVLVFIMPFMILLLLCTWIVKRKKIFKILKLILPMAATAVYFYLACMGVILVAFTTYPDSRLTDDLLVTNKGWHDSYYVYYEPVGPFLRRSASLTTQHKLNYLKEKYDCNFIVDQENMIYDAEYPDIKVTVYVTGSGTSGIKLADDYVERIKAYREAVVE